MLESFYYQLFADSGRYNRLGSYWEKGNKNEIDLVGVNDLKKEIVIAEIKFNKDRISIEELKRKSATLLAAYPGYEATFLALGQEDVGSFLRGYTDIARS